MVNFNSHNNLKKKIVWFANFLYFLCQIKIINNINIPTIRYTYKKNT